jgi:hypothetical protein
LRELLTNLSNTDQNSFELLYDDIKGIYTGTIYTTKNKNINAFINNPKQQSQSFRTFLITFVNDDYKRKYADAIDKATFYETFREYFTSKTNVALNSKLQAELKGNKFKELSNNHIIELIDSILVATVTDMSTLPESKVGHGLKPSEKQIHRKYFIDTHKLNNNILEVRYNKNRHLTNVKTQVIGHGVKNIIHSIINNDDMNQNEYHVLTEQEKHLIRTILNMVTVLAIIMVSAVIFPILRQALIVDLIVKAKSIDNTNIAWHRAHASGTTTEIDLVQEMLDSIRSSDIFLIIYLFISSVMMISTGISYNYIQSTVTSVFLFVFAIIWFGVVMMSPNTTFIKDNFDINEGDLNDGLHKKPSFDQSSITAMSVIRTIIFNNFQYIKEGKGFINNYGYALGAVALSLSMSLILSFAFGMKPEIVASYTFMFAPLSVYIAIFLKFVMNS